MKRDEDHNWDPCVDGSSQQTKQRWLLVEKEVLSSIQFYIITASLLMSSLLLRPSIGVQKILMSIHTVSF